MSFAIAGLVVATALGALATLAVRQSPASAPLQVGPHRFAAGVQFDGDGLPSDHPLYSEEDDLVPPAASAEPAVSAAPAAAAAPAMATAAPATSSTASSPVVAAAGAAPPRLALRRHCAWGTPGANPYRGSVEQALRAARLPEAVVQRVAHEVREGRPTERLTLARGEIRALDSGRRFDPGRIALTFGTTLCLDSAINFRPGHTEGADLYSVVDDEGAEYHVMVPEVCGNVSVLGVRAERNAAAPVRRGEGPLAAMRRVAEPGTLGLGLLGLALAAGLSTRRRRARRQPPPGASGTTLTS